MAEAVPPSLPVSNSLDSSPEPGAGAATKPSRPRPFIASQACDHCRLKKTKCDEDRPRCSTCARSGLECHYAEAKSTKKDKTISKIYSSISRLERKIEDVATLIRQQNGPFTDPPQDHQPSSADNSHESGHRDRLSIADVLNTSPAIKHVRVRTNANSLFASMPLSSTGAGGFADGAKQMSFSAHRILQWPAIHALLPDAIQGTELVGDYATKLEATRSPLPFTISAPGASSSWLQSLSISVIRGLTEAYFNTFNTSNPILDREYFYTATLSAAVESSFGYNIESCVLLVVLALGCLAVTAHREADFPLYSPRDEEPKESPLGFVPPEWIDITEEAEGLPSGLRFFNEQRKRSGFLMCGTGLEYVQCHLLTGLYYAQAVRVLDHWHMVNKAAVGCLMLLNGSQADSYNWDSWKCDMLARVFWNILMFESILVQELDVPPSGLSDYEDIVPLPRFPSYPSSPPKAVEENDTNYQYHFLAQAAHRKLLNRMRNSIYTYEPEMPQFPSIALSRELQIQLDLWRSTHPPSIQQDPQNNIGATYSPASPTKLASHIMSAMLHGRYRVGMHLMRRPFVYKVLHTPADKGISEEDLNEVRLCLENAVAWPQITGVFEKARTAIPIKFGFGSQFMGQLLLFKGVEQSARAEVRACLPPGWEAWVGKVFAYLRAMAPKSPTLARDVYILEALYQQQ
ncbi:hypothetical protein Dda_9319 [Drechslerella dactyloides]|uniref:Zn(2)-C6 fungal-type domain-containing protein n=1 Tax=Drechslerella dactyloides TaxID=74499 RepID=A0AAD6IPD3_DREDA|nr:hypothetical protein Dda_9319 [Drechslerella dactyloides]